VLENEPTHRIMCSLVSDDSILPITVNRTGVPVFWSQTLWMRFLSVSATCLDYERFCLINEQNRPFFVVLAGLEPATSPM
jgi:hypothetical protein